MATPAPQPWRRQCLVTAVAWALLAAIWLPARLMALGDEAAYLLLPGIMASPFIAAWAATETLAWLQAWPQRRQLDARRRQVVRLRALALVVVVALAAIAYGEWRSEQSLRRFYEHSRAQAKPAAPDSTD